MTEPQTRAAVDVKLVTNSRELHFNSLSEIVDEARRLVAGSAAVRPLGNLTLGQALKHMALTMHAGFDGFGFTIPTEVQAFAKAHKVELFAGHMRPGTKLPPAGEARFIPACCTPQEGLSELEAAVARLQAGAPQQEHPYLGELSAPEWVSLHCRHAELHLGFMLGGECEPGSAS
jgi:hypothetical protein